jgi:hypothetical protein
VKPELLGSCSRSWWAEQCAVAVGLQVVDSAGEAIIVDSTSSSNSTCILNSCYTCLDEGNTLTNVWSANLRDSLC